MTSHNTLIAVAAAVFVTGCAAETPYNLLEDYEELDSTTVVAAPRPATQRVAPADRDAVERGGYLVELLGCGACHTDGALEGAPDRSRALAGSRTGIAYTNPLEHEFPGVVYPPNITPDDKTGIGRWSDAQIANAVSAGASRHGSRRLVTMPWQGYAKLNDDDLDAIVAYLRSIESVEFEVPGEVRPGQRAPQPFVYFGVYRARR